MGWELQPSPFLTVQILQVIQSGSVLIPQLAVMRGELGVDKTLGDSIATSLRTNDFAFGLSAKYRKTHVEKPVLATDAGTAKH